METCTVVRAFQDVFFEALYQHVYQQIEKSTFPHNLRFSNRKLLNEF